MAQVLKRLFAFACNEDSLGQETLASTGGVEVTLSCADMVACTGGVACEKTVAGHWSP